MPITISGLVLGEGSKNSKICLVGEAPGTSEVAIGRPFVGASGKLLNECLRTAGIIRSDCYLTNVVKVQPPKNNITKYIELKKGRALVTEEYKQFESALYSELAEVNANVFVAVGATAMYALTRQFGVMKRRGSMYNAVINGKTIKVIPIIHPSAAFGKYLLRYNIINDLRKVKRESEYPELRLPERTLRLGPSFLDALDYIHQCSKAEKVGFDIEVMRGEVSCLALALSPQDAMCIPFLKNGMDEYFTMEHEQKIMLEISKLLENPDVTKVGQNMVFDGGFMLDKYGTHTVNIDDTMIAQAIIYPEFAKGLDYLTSMYTDEPYYKDEGKMHFKYGGTDEAFWRYNALDAVTVMEILPFQLIELERLGNMETYKRQIDIIYPLMYMQQHGMYVDKEGMKKESVKAAEIIAECTERLHRKVGFELNPASPKQLAEYFYERLGITPYTKSVKQPGGGRRSSVTTDEKAMIRIARKGKKGAEEAQFLLYIRKYAKLKGTYFDMETDDDDRLRSSFNPVGTVNGRLSSGKTIFDRGGNFQNQPPASKRYIKTDPGTIMGNIDLSQAENRIVAYIAPELKMIKCFEDGNDVHCLTASMIFGIPPDEVKQMHKDKIMCDLGNGESTHRDRGKESNHGFNYDWGYKSFAIKNEIAEADGKFLKAKYLLAYPGVKMYHSWVRDKLGQGRILTNCLGRQRMFMNAWGDELFKQAYNYIPQSTVADVINERGLSYIYNNSKQFGPIRIVNQIHDSIHLMIPLDVPADEVVEMLHLIRQSLETPLGWLGREFVIPADLDFTNALSDDNKIEVDFPSLDTAGYEEVVAKYKEDNK